MSQQVRLYELATLSKEKREQLLERTESDLSGFIEKVGPIIKAVEKSGDKALSRFAGEFDNAPVGEDEIAAAREDFDQAFIDLDDQLIDVLEFSADNIRKFHEKQMPEEMRMTEIRPGLFAGERYTPIESVAIYVPRGKGAFPSMALMASIPAVVAGVPNAIMLTPPGPDGKVDAATLVAAQISGIDKVYKCGGAQAVAAAAFGTQTIPKCSKILGPGSPWVMAAKQLLSGRIDPGIPAGPSESIVLADETANADIAALDLMIESEHGPDSSAFLVTDSREIAEQAGKIIPIFWEKMGTERVSYSSAVLCGDRGGIILAPDLEQAIQFINDYAPEHLEIQSREPFSHIHKIKNAGEILLGEHTPLTLGNYLLGPNAILPTAKAALTTSPLGVFDYLKSTSIGYVTSSGYKELAEKAHIFAQYEGFDAHANAVSDIRPEILSKDK